MLGSRNRCLQGWCARPRPVMSCVLLSSGNINATIPLPLCHSTSLWPLNLQFQQINSESSTNMPPQRARISRFSAIVPPPGAHPALPTNNRPNIPRKMIHPPSRQQRIQHSKERLETIIAQIYGEYINLLGINDKIRDTLQKEKAEKEELHAYIQYHDYCLQAAEKRAWGFEKQSTSWRWNWHLGMRRLSPIKGDSSEIGSFAISAVCIDRRDCMAIIL